MTAKNIIDAQQIIHQAKISGQIPLLVESILINQVITKAAAENNIVIKDEELQKAADEFRVSLDLTSASKTLEWLQYNQLSVEDFEQMISRQLLTQKLAIHLFANQVEPTFVQDQLKHTAAVMYEVIFDDVGVIRSIVRQYGEQSHP